MSEAENKTNESDLSDLASRPHILVVDDDDRIRDLLTRYLTQCGMVVCAAQDASHAREMMQIFEFDLLVVDIMMPGETGLAFTQGLRKESNILVILLTALGEAQDRITGLESGADDYLAKPFEPKELVLRIESLLRRAPPKGQIDAKAGKSFQIGRWLYKPGAYELTDDQGMAVPLTKVEDTLLTALSVHMGQAVSRETLAQMCGVDGEERTIDVQVTRVRRKIEDDPKMPRHLKTVRGKGYMLRADTAL